MTVELFYSTCGLTALLQEDAGVNLFSQTQPNSNIKNETRTTKIHWLPLRS